MLMRNYVGGPWVASSATDSLAVLNPATREHVSTTPLSTAHEVGDAVDAASRAFPAWRRTPVTDRVQYLFKLKEQLERQFENLTGIQSNAGSLAARGEITSRHRESVVPAARPFIRATTLKTLTRHDES